MAEQMQDIKRRIKSVSSTERITNAMKLVSASKLRRSKNVYEHSQGFLADIFQSMADALVFAERVPREYVDSEKEVKNKCYVLITSSNGLCGGFNTNIIKALEEHLQTEDAGVKLATIGTKGKDYFERRGYNIAVVHDDPADSITFEEAKKVVAPLIEMYDAGIIDEIDLCYTSYINTLKQEVVIKKLLPFHLEDFHAAASLDHMVHEMEYDPSPLEVFHYMVPRYIELQLYSAAIESATCEHAARRSAMENANDNARDMLSALQIHYNRARQAEITDEIIEIVAGSEAQR